MAGQPVTDVYVEEPDAGILYCASGFPRGVGNVILSNTAGYSATTMPNDLKRGILVAIQDAFKRQSEETSGVKQFRIGDYSVTFKDGLPTQTQVVIDKYRRSV